MLRLIGNTNKDENDVLILDARSKVAAQGNRVLGGGFEQETYYTNCKVTFCSIDNIHGVRSAYQICFPNWDEQWYSKSYDEIISKINSSKWLELLSTILKHSALIAETLDYDLQSVLVHCSDGWDRTAQLCCLSELLLDPFYRTLKGFEVLIEKEWVSFGHQFDLRSGNFVDESVERDEKSPVFIQFLDCVFQLQQQFPTVFQFTIK